MQEVQCRKRVLTGILRNLLLLVEVFQNATSKIVMQADTARDIKMRADGIVFHGLNVYSILTSWNMSSTDLPENRDNTSSLTMKFMATWRSFLRHLGILAKTRPVLSIQLRTAIGLHTVKAYLISRLPAGFGIRTAHPDALFSLSLTAAQLSSDGGRSTKISVTPASSSL